MSLQIVATQMAVIFVMMAIGYWLGKKNRVTRPGAKEMSYIISNVANPALMLSGALGKTGSVPVKNMLFMAAVSILIDAVLVLLGCKMGSILRVLQKEKFSYNLMTVFGNTGMIGIPIVSVVLGSQALVYIGIFNVLYMFLMYTYGVLILEKESSKAAQINLKRCLLNPGTIIAVISIFIFACDLTAPHILCKIADDIGGSTCFLSILVIGIAMTHVPLGSIFKNFRLYLFSVLRYLLLPVLGAMVLKKIIGDPMILHVCILVLSMPVANMPAILAEERGLSSELITRGIILTTVLSLVFIPFVTIFV